MFKREIFINEHERKNVIEYWGIFLNEMNALLPYFVDFKKDVTILSKKYWDDCTVVSSDQQPIIIITYDESIFSINNSCQKV